MDSRLVLQNLDVHSKTDVYLVLLYGILVCLCTLRMWIGSLQDTHSCDLQEVMGWMNANKLRLKPDMTEVLLVGPDLVF